MIHYSITFNNPKAHLINVSCRLDKPNPQGQRFSLPAWLPGSYMIRDFAKHLNRLKIMSNNQEVDFVQIDKSTWEIEPTSTPIEISYEIYAWELNPRGAHVDAQHAFFDGSRVFIYFHAFEENECEVSITPGFFQQNSAVRVATAMPVKKVDNAGFGTYWAKNYKELIDHPFEVGEYEEVSFHAHGVPHKIIISGHCTADLDRLEQDVKTICEAHMSLFGTPWPTNQYLFLLYTLSNGYGGLEHRSSSMLLCSWEDLPLIHQKDMTTPYMQLLGLFSHEYFHTWNVKKMLPKVVQDSSLLNEAYTRQLWIFEGITSYFDDYQLCRTGLISQDQYLDLLSKSFNRIHQNPGTYLQDLETSSFEAWTKFYKQDENSANTIVSYYVKGSLVSWLLDLIIRHETNHHWSLAKVMRSVWQSHGLKEKAYEEGEFEKLVITLTGCDLAGFFEHHLRSAKPLQINEVISPFGLELVIDTDNQPTIPYLGIKTVEVNAVVQVSQVLSNTPGEQAGLAAGDVFVAIDNMQVTAKNFDMILARYHDNDILNCHIFRAGQLIVLQIELSSSHPDVMKFQVKSELDNIQNENLNKWLGINE